MKIRLRGFRRFFIHAIAFAALAAPIPAIAAQGTGCVPTTGQFSGLVLVQDVNAALAALISSNSGGSAPVTDCSGASVPGQFWLDTSSTPNVLRLYDGTNFLPIGRTDATNHIWAPPVGGGLGSISAAASIDLCSVAPAFVTITGNAAIQTFGGSCVAGQVKVVRFAAAGGSLVAGSSIILPAGGASLATAAGDVAVAVYLTGGTWQVVSYQPAAGTAVVPPPNGITGQHMEFWGASCPATWVQEDGSAISRTSNSALFAIMGTAYGAGDGSTTFNLPDTRGLFTRGLNASSSGTDASRTLGSVQQDSVGPHTHGFTDNFSSAQSGAAGGGPYAFGYNTSTSSTTTSQTPSGTTETRPKNVALLYCVKL